MTDFSRKFSNNITSLFLILILLSSAHYLRKLMDKPIIKISKQDSAFNLNAKIVDTFSLGYRRFITSFFWISTILESDHEHYKNKDSNSWMFLRFNLISQLDPKFYENYAFGGQYLSIIKDDDIGAKIIFDKGLTQYPDDYHLLLTSSFHYYFELNDYEKAVLLYKKLITYPQVPKHIVSFYAKMISKENAQEEAFEILLDLYEKNKHIEVFEKRYRENLYSIRAEIDLNCLNSKIRKIKCNRYDFDGKPYLFKEKYYAQKKWIKLKPYQAKTNNE